MQLFAGVQFNICWITKSRKEFRVSDFQTTGAASQVFLKIATPNILENNYGEQLWLFHYSNYLPTKLLTLTWNFSADILPWFCIFENFWNEYSSEGLSWINSQLKCLTFLKYLTFDIFDIFYAFFLYT